MFAFACLVPKRFTPARPAKKRDADLKLDSVGLALSVKFDAEVARSTALAKLKCEPDNLIHAEL